MQDGELDSLCELTDSNRELSYRIKLETQCESKYLEISLFK